MKVPAAENKPIFLIENRFDKYALINIDTTVVDTI